MNMQLLNSVQSIKDDKNIIEIVAPQNTDNFNDMFGKTNKFTAPFYYTMYKGDFILQCEIEPEFLSTYDAGAIFVCESSKKWIKLAFENTDLGYPAIVNVVTDKISDDCNGERITEKSVWLQIVRKGDYWCTHYSIDKKNWKMVRLFKLPMKRELMLGISAQSPLGKGCKAIFRNLTISPNTYKDIRKAI